MFQAAGVIDRAVRPDGFDSAGVAVPSSILASDRDVETVNARGLLAGVDVDQIGVSGMGG